MKKLDNKKVLLMAPRFFGYEIEIANEMIKRGAKVDFLPDRPFNHPWQAGLTLLAPFIIQPFVNRFYYKELDKLNSEDYDFILVINGQTLTTEVIAKLKVSFPRARFLLYMWDSIENRPNVKKTLSYFDDAFSFDPNSAEKYKMRFRPLFYCKDFENQNKQNYKFNISFVGTMHSDRYDVIAKLRKHLPSNIKSFWYFYLQAKWVYWAYRVLKRPMRSAKINEFEYQSIEKKKVQEVFATSQTVLDIEHPNQHGLTMRTIETLGSNKKLITTNNNIEQYDFFNVNNICIINRENPIVPESFFDTYYQPLSPEIYYKYSLSGWLDEVLGF